MRCVSIAILFLVPICSFAQLHTSETWFGAEASFDIFQNVNLDFEADMRFVNETFALKSHSQELGFGYGISKTIKIGAAYQLTHKNYAQGLFPVHTTSANIRYRAKIKFFRFDYRNKFEASRTTYFEEMQDVFLSYENRNRIKVSYKRKKFFFEPNVTFETFHPISVENGYNISEIRLGTGVSFAVFKTLSLDIGYTYKKTYQKKIPKTVSVFAFVLSKSF